MLLAVADDLSGAAEIAGIGHRHGLSVDVLTGQAQLDSNAELVVISTETRDVSRQTMEASLRELLVRFPATTRSRRLFKKVDSVLRGHVVAETELLRHHQGFERVLLVPANPSRGRVVREGAYWIEQTPLHLTGFADASSRHATSSDVRSLLGAELEGWTIPDTVTRDDLLTLLSHATDRTLVVGAADAFEVMLETELASGPGRRPEAQSPPTPPSPSFTLILNGSRMPPPSDPAAFASHRIPVYTTAVDVRAQGLRQLQANHRAVAIDAAGDWNQIPALLASMPQDLLPQLHLALTGGSTAAAVLAQMGGRSFAVAREFAPGVVTLRPTTTGPAAVTIKPGSYAWPDSFFDWITA